MLHGQQLKSKGDAALAEGRGVASMTAEEFAGFMIRCGGIDKAIESLTISVGLMRTARVKVDPALEPVGLSFIERVLRLLQDARLHDETFDPYAGPGEVVFEPPDEEVEERGREDADA